MRTVKFEKNFTTTISGFFQYDYGQIIEVLNSGAHIPDLQFDFIQNHQQITVLGTYNAETDSYQVRIPDTFLQNPEDILTYLYYEDPEMGQTIKIIIIKITAREKYEDIPDPEHHGVVEQILEKLAEMQEEIDNWTITDEQLQAIVDEVEASIDLNDYYDKQEVDTLLSGKASTATVQENTEDIEDLEIAMASKVDISELANYYTKAQTYSQAEVNALIAAISTLNIAVVNALPTENISTTTIYLVPKQTAQTSNIKDEYINLDGTTAGWELIGTTEIDLSNYVTSSNLATILADYVTATGLNTILADYATTSAMNTALADKADASDLIVLTNRVSDIEDEIDGVNAVLDTILNI